MIKGSGPGGRITVSDVEQASVPSARPAAVGMSPARPVTPTLPPQTVVTEGMFWSICLVDFSSFKM